MKEINDEYNGCIERGKTRTKNGVKRNKIMHEKDILRRDLACNYMYSRTIA